MPSLAKPVRWKLVDSGTWRWPASPATPLRALSSSPCVKHFSWLYEARSGTSRQSRQIADPQSAHLATAVLPHGVPVSLSLDTYSIWQKVFKFNDEASDVYRQCLWSGCGVPFTARGSEWISAVPSSRRGATIRKASSSFFNLACSICFDPNATNLARISNLLADLKRGLSHARKLRPKKSRS
jgi:hypothetical protein